jgi:glycosyltransferase involved in cell wall biosynthesis
MLQNEVLLKKKLSMDNQVKIGVIIPTYKCKNQIMWVLANIREEVTRIYVIDDCCPEGTGTFVKENCKDPRVGVYINSVNQGVGGATIAGYIQSIRDGMDIAVKIDGDGQMDPALLKQFVSPIINGSADYTKGNRFSKIENIRQMPRVRVLGNLALSFITKASTGYWKILDPNNGYTAIHVRVLAQLDLCKISRRYFFESDMLFRLGLVGAKVQDMPMASKYADEVSNLKITRVTSEFAFKHLKNFLKRIFYQYFVLDFNFASVELIMGLVCFYFGVGYGVYHWTISYETNTLAPTGTIMAAVLPIILGFQFLMGFVNFDINRTPNEALQKFL